MLILSSRKGDATIDRTEHRDIAIVGAGAAGLATAIFAAEGIAGAGGSPSIVLLEGAPRIGAKILVAGGGRCNVTHERVAASDYHGSQPVVRNVLRAFDADAAARWFAALGVALKREETGKLFPVTDSARTVVDALVGRARELGVEIRLCHRVESIAPPGGAAGSGFRVRHAAGTLTCDRLVLATGGRSLPKSGSDGKGYDFARALGHGVTDTWPALVPLRLADGFAHRDLSGVAHRARVTVRIDGRRHDERTGDLLWTHFGISGPVAMDISRSWIRPHEQALAPTLEVHFVPDETHESLSADFLDTARQHPQRSVERWLSSRLPRRVGRWLCARSAIEPGLAAARATRAERRRLLAELTGCVLPVVGPRGWNAAEVTAGGVPLAEVNRRTFASRRTEGLYLVGEILDCDGRIGGFNFQWAWASGYLAGTALARAARLRRPERRGTA